MALYGAEYNKLQRDKYIVHATRIWVARRINRCQAWVAIFSPGSLCRSLSRSRSRSRAGGAGSLDVVAGDYRSVSNPMIRRAKRLRAGLGPRSPDGEQRNGRSTRHPNDSTARATSAMPRYTYLSLLLATPAV